MTHLAEQLSAFDSEAVLPAGKTRNPLDTPMLRQYLELKSTVADSILFFRMGDFYEMFLEDAVIAAPILDLQLTSRNKGDPDEVPLCGFPHSQLDDYVSKMISTGRKVAICEQVEAPPPMPLGKNGKSTGPKIFKREITRIVTPGLLTQGEAADGKQESPRYLAALFPSVRKPGAKKSSVVEARLGLAYLDISTGEFRATDLIYQVSSDVNGEGEVALPPDILFDELARLNPAELLLPVAMSENAESDLFSRFAQALQAGLSKKIPLTRRAYREFGLELARQKLCEAFKTQSLDGFGLEDLSEGIGAAGAILEYVRETQRGRAEHICKLLPYRLKQSLRMDAATRRNLEITETSYNGDRGSTLCGILDGCLTRQGSRLLNQWLSSPLIEIEAINERFSSVAALIEALNEGRHEIARLQEILRRVNDLERICSRIALGTAAPRDCVALGQTLGCFPEIVESLQRLGQDGLALQRTQLSADSLLGKIKATLSRETFSEISTNLADILAEVSPGMWREGGFVRAGFSKNLDDLRSLMQNTKSYITALENREREKSGIQSLKVRYNKVFGYYIEITKSYLDRVPDYFIRKQTLVNAERFIVPELKDFEERLLSAESEAQKLELQIFQDLLATLKAELSGVLESSEAIAILDVLLNFAKQAFDWNYVRPTLTTQRLFRIRGGRHPVLERLIKLRLTPQAEAFVPNDLEMDADSRQILLITGPNMAGKSTLMRQLALISLMAQCGSYVPAQEATLGLVDGIFTRVGANDHLTLGQSTFMVEMNETANILNNATAQSLVILDEIGRGTSTFDGLSIAWAVAEYIHDHIGARTLFATHYHELAALPALLPRAINCSVAVKEWNHRIIFLRKLVEGATNRSYGIQVARLAGLPETVLKRAREVLAGLEGAKSHAQAKSNSDDGEGSVNLALKQFELFAGRPEVDENHLTSAQKQILDGIKAIALDELRPIDALKLLSEWQKNLL